MALAQGTEGELLSFLSCVACNPIQAVSKKLWKGSGYIHCKSVCSKVSTLAVESYTPQRATARRGEAVRRTGVALHWLELGVLVGDGMRFAVVEFDPRL